MEFFRWQKVTWPLKRFKEINNGYVYGGIVYKDSNAVVIILFVGYLIKIVHFSIRLFFLFAERNYFSWLPFTINKNVTCLAAERECQK